MGREEGGGFRMGNTCMPVAASFRYIAEPIQYVKFKNKIKFKNIKKKKEVSIILSLANDLQQIINFLDLVSLSVK